MKKECVISKKICDVEKDQIELFYKDLYEKKIVIDKPKTYELLCEIGKELQKLWINNCTSIDLYNIAYSYVIRKSKYRLCVFTFLKEDEHNEFIINNEYIHYTGEEFLDLLKKVNKLNEKKFEIKKKDANNYVITFNKAVSYKNRWVSLSSIEKELFYEFVDYLYMLKRPIIVDKYNCGKMHHQDYDFTFVVKNIIEDIKNNIDKYELLNKYCANYYMWEDQDVSDIPLKIYFSEDIYELYKSLEIPNEIALKAIDEQYDKNDIYKILIINNRYKNKLKEFADYFNNEDYFPYTSRWQFIYMFRSEFILFMEEKGKEVVIEDGWILNDKLREIKIQLINHKGELI